MANIGELADWKIEAHLTAARELVRSDDVLLALDLLTTHLPAFYRQFPPKEVLDLRREIEGRIATPDFYAREEEKCDYREVEHATQLLRGKLLLEECNALNEKGITPHIADMGPGNFWVPLMLKRQMVKFTYEPITLTKASRQGFMAQQHPLFGMAIEGAPKIFLALELIEHLQNPADIRSTMIKHCGLADVVHISTPLYSFDGSERPMAEVLGHLRAFTPNELMSTVIALFPEYDWKFFNDNIMHVRLELRK